MKIEEIKLGDLFECTKICRLHPSSNMANKLTLFMPGDIVMIYKIDYTLYSVHILNLNMRMSDTGFCPMQYEWGFDKYFREVT